MSLLHQALVISKWIESFDSQNVNDFFKKDSTLKDPMMVQNVQMQFKVALHEIEHSRLSPNLNEMNKHL